MATRRHIVRSAPDGDGPALPAHLRGVQYVEDWLQPGDTFSHASPDVTASWRWRQEQRAWMGEHPEVVVWPGGLRPQWRDEIAWRASR